MRAPGRLACDLDFNKQIPHERKAEITNTQKTGLGGFVLTESTKKEWTIKKISLYPSASATASPAATASSAAMRDVNPAAKFESRAGGQGQ